MRTYKNITFDKDRETIRLMQLLTEPDVSVEDYRHAFYRLGRELGLLLNEKAGGNYGNTMLACASEDADWHEACWMYCRPIRCPWLCFGTNG